MTRLKKIKAFIKALSGQLGIKFVRAEQSGQRPAYPFLSYKVLSSDGGSAQETIETQELIAGNETQVIKKQVRESALVISLNFISDEKGYESLFELAEEAYSWIDSLDALIAADEIGIGVRIVNYIQDRTVFFETEYEYRFGFDFEVRDKAVSEKLEDVIDVLATVEDILAKGETND